MMIFEYTQVTPKISRPLIQVRITHKNKFIITSALIDSGSDYCIFPIDYATELQIPISKMKRRPFSGFFGESSTLRLYTINLSLEDHSVQLIAGFAEFIGRYSYSVLGQLGFFDNFKVCFDKARLQLSIDPK